MDRKIFIFGGLFVLILFLIILDYMLLPDYYLFYGILMYIGLLIPDIAYLKKKKSCHSWKMIKYLTYAVFITIFLGFIFKPLLFITAFFIGYILHLLIESLDETGLPKK